MAEQLDLAIVLKAILDAKGFEQAQTAIKGLAGATNNAKPSTEGLSKSQKELNRELGGNRGAVADLTRVLLQNIGVTGPAGEVAKALGTAMSAVGGGATLAAVGATAFVGVAALAAPNLMDWMRAANETAEAQKALLAAIVEGLPELVTLREHIDQVNGALDRQIAATRVLALNAQTERIAKLKEELAQIRAQLPEQAMIRETHLKMKDALELVNEMEKSAIGFVDEKTKKETLLWQQLEAKRALLERLESAQRRGLSLEEDEKRASEETTQARKAEAEAIAAQKRAREGLNAALDEGRRGALETRMRDAQIGLAKDSEALAKKEKKQKDGQLTEDVKRLLVLGDEEAQLAADRERLAQEELDRDRQAAAEKRAMYAGLIADATSGLTAFFGNNKTAMIAQALVDTYAGAAKAFAQGGVIGFVTGGAIIARGLAYVANMRKQEIGFDDPRNDEIVRQFGRKWANDMSGLLNEGFYGQVGNLMGGGGGSSTTVYDQRTIQQGTTHNYGGIHGLMAMSPTQFYRGLERAQVKAERFRRRTTIGGGRRSV